MQQFRCKHWEFVAHLETFFSFHNLQSKVRLSKLQKLYPSAIDKCAMVFVPPLAVEKLRNWGVLLTPLHNIQMGGAFITAFTSEKQWMTITKSLFRDWQLIPNFFIAHLSILVRCKTKGAIGAVCVHITAQLAINCLTANYSMGRRFEFTVQCSYLFISC